jgi:acetylglutamate kinase
VTVEKLYVIKIGGFTIDQEVSLSMFLQQIAAIPGKKVIVHGGGKLATTLADRLGIVQHLVDGRRITDAETLKIVTMVYAGYINKNIVAQLGALSCLSIGLCGADADLIRAHKRKHPSIDYGFVGDVEAINSTLLKNLLNQGLTVVIAPVTHNNEGQLLNTNADTIAQETAKALAADFEVTLIYCFEKAGVLADIENEQSVIGRIDKTSYQDLKEKKVIFAGMLPKLDNAFAALEFGVSRVVIGKAENINQLIAGTSGTTVIRQ